MVITVYNSVCPGTGDICCIFEVFTGNIVVTDIQCPRCTHIYRGKPPDITGVIQGLGRPSTGDVCSVFEVFVCVVIITDIRGAGRSCCYGPKLTHIARFVKRENIPSAGLGYHDSKTKKYGTYHNPHLFLPHILLLLSKNNHVNNS
ncbi:MAG: hypothetical protein E3K29_02370 [Candidatus Brocadia sp.]|nr:hypothetical protein [Candidatus Brocadia sp.]